jgi:DNA-binding NarL/FixJ family response regulator
MEEPLRVLIADDRPSSRKGLKALLGTCPEMEVVGEAADGEEAVRMAGECRPDVVLIDIRMPNMDGLQATRLLKANHPELRVVILTLYPKYDRQARANGADAFLVKGCPTEELLNTILEKTEGQPGRGIQA